MSLLPLPESFPAGYIAQTEHFYTANQMIAYGQQCRRKALQEVLEMLLDTREYTRYDIASEVNRELNQ